MGNILITGSAQGIGKAMALHLAKHEYTIIVHYNNSQTEAKKVLAEIQKNSSNSIMLQADLTQLDQVEEMFKQVENKLGALDGLINNVGELGPYIPLSKVSLEEFDNVINTNVRATFICSKLALPLLKQSKAGRIINFSSASADQILARKYTTPYYIAKNGIVTLTKSWAQELAQDSITVNSIAPGIVENSDIQVQVPMERLASFEDINSVIDFLISDKASYISGATIEVSGGWEP